MSRFSPLLFSVLLALPVRAQTLAGFASFPARSFVAGPTSGQKIEVKDGLIALPFQNQQPVQGFSSLWRVAKSEFLALEDNGYGTKANSADFLLRVVRFKFDFKTAKRNSGAGTAQVVSTLELRDPNGLVTWPLVRADRRLTGADFDPESFVVARDGTLWMGDEFGPFLLHFSRKGELLDAPFVLAGVASPDDPLGRTATIGRSRGFEGLAFANDKKHVWALLEGAVTGDDPRDLRASEFDLDTKKWTGNRFVYRLEPSETVGVQHSIGEMTATKKGQFLVAERDGLYGETAAFKRIYKCNAKDHSKTLVADLLHIGDPGGLGPSQNGVYRMQFETIESIVVLDKTHLLVCNDNNFPFGRGRGKDRIEDSEFAVLQLDVPLH